MKDAYENYQHEKQQTEKNKSIKTTTLTVMKMCAPIVKISELLRIPIDYVDGKIDGDELVKVINGYLTSMIYKRGVAVPVSLGSAFKELDHLEYDLLLIFNALNELDDKQKQIIYALHFKQMTQHEIAGELGISRSSVQRLKSKAEMALLNQLFINHVSGDE